MPFTVDHDDSPCPPAPPIISPHGWCRECGVHHIPRTHGKSFEHVGCPKKEPVVLPVLVIGDKGTGVGSRIQGHARRGGATMRRNHRRFAVVAMHDEYKTSKVCTFCWRPTALARARRFRNGQVQTLRVNGSVECVNPACISFRAGYTIKARDPHSALAILLSGTSVLESPCRQPLPPFARTSTNNTRATLVPALPCTSTRMQARPLVRGLCKHLLPLTDVKILRTSH